MNFYIKSKHLFSSLYSSGSVGGQAYERGTISPIYEEEQHKICSISFFRLIRQFEIHGRIWGFIGINSCRGSFG